MDSSDMPNTESEITSTQYFVSSTFDRTHRTALRRVLAPVFADRGLTPYFAEKKWTGEMLQGKMLERIQGTRFGVYDVTGSKPNVLIELGMALALHKPCLIIARQATSGKPLSDPVERLIVGLGLEFISYREFSELQSALRTKVPDSWWGFREGVAQCANCCVVEGGRECPRLHSIDSGKGRTYLIGIGDSAKEKDHWKSVEGTLDRKGFALSPVLLTDSPRHSFTVCDYCEKVRVADFGIFHLGSEAEPHSSVYLTLGMAIALQRPFVLLRGVNFEPLPALLTGTRCLRYGSPEDISKCLWPEMESQVLPKLRPHENPFRGLEAFGEKNADQFAGLGRTGKVARIVDLFAEPGISAVELGEASAQTVIVYGESGVGKTSLIHAGVLPDPRIRGAGWVPVSVSVGELDPADTENKLREKLSEIMPKVTVAGKGLAELSEKLNEQGKNLLLVMDQFERVYERDETARRAVLDFVSALAEQTRFGLLIGIREDYYAWLDHDYAADRKLFPESRTRRVSREGIDRLEPKQAVEAIVYLSRGIFARPMVECLVDTLCQDKPGQTEKRPHTPYIQLVCQRLWDDLVLDGDRLPFVTEGDCDQNTIKATMDRYLENTVSGMGSDLEAIAGKVLRSLVKDSSHDKEVAVREWRTERHVLESVGADARTVQYAIDELVRRRLVDRRWQEGQREVQVIHDFLAQTILTKYNYASISLHQAAEKLVSNLETILNEGMDEGAREQAALVFTRNFVSEQYATFAELQPADKAHVSLGLTRQSAAVAALLDTLSAPGRPDKGEARLVLDCLCQVLLLLGAYGPARKLHHVQEDLTIPESFWTSARSQKKLLPTDEALLRFVLGLAQQEQERTLVELRAEVPASLKLDSRLPIWRVLYRLWRDGQILRKDEATGKYEPAKARAKEWPPVDLLSYRWIIAPDTAYLRKHKALQDLRSYQGVIVHVPAGEHAMRNQRVARKLMIRTVAIEKGTRSTAPGYHEADDHHLITNYDDEEFKPLLRRIAYDNAVLLNKPDSKLCVVLEAQEYPVEKMATICRDINDELRRMSDARRKYQRIQGAVVTDVGASIANRKDLTRGLATLSDVDQPPYRVLCVKDEPVSDRKPVWDRIWKEGMEQRNALLRLPESWKDLSEESRRAAWIDALREAVRAVGGKAVVKPVTTEFLKGATLVTLAEKDLALAWRRAAKVKFVFPQVVVEQQILNIDRELLVTLVKQPDSPGRSGRFVSVPPVWYKCITPRKWKDDDSYNSVPFAMDHAWVTQGNDKDAAVFARALEDSQRMAEQLWTEIANAGYDVNNRFLQFEWFVLKDGRLMLNEIKPTQLDKGIISGTAFTHSDSELLVRNLFGLPLPDEVRLIRPHETILVGAVLVKDARDFRPIRDGRMLISYAGIDRALNLGADVFLYSDKMRSIPYIGRRMGILTVSADNYDDALRIFEAARAALQPQYEAPVR